MCEQNPQNKDENENEAERLHRVPPAPNLACTDVDFKGVVYGTQLSIHFMRKNPVPGGKIIATASVAGIYPHESYPEYNGAKAAVINFARGAAPVLKLVSATHTTNCEEEQTHYY